MYFCKLHLIFIQSYWSSKLFFSDGMMMLSSRIVPRVWMNPKRTKDSWMILCDQNSTRNSWKNTSSSTVLCAVVLKDLEDHGCSLPFPQNSRLNTWSWIPIYFSKIIISFIIHNCCVLSFYSCSMSSFSVLIKSVCVSWMFFCSHYFLLSGRSMVEKSWFAISTSNCLNCFPKEPVFIVMVVCNLSYLCKH